MAYVTLNSKKYAVDEIAQYLVQPLSVPFRTTGDERRSDNTVVTPYVWTAATLAKMGVGHSYAQREATGHGRGVGGMRDAAAHTCFETQVTLPLLNQDATDPTDATEMVESRVAIEYLNELFVFGEHGSQEATANQWDGSSTDWGSASTEIIGSGGGQVFLDVVKHQGNVVALIIANTNGGADHVVYRSTGALTSWANASTPITADLLTAITSGEDINGGLLVELGGTIYAAIWHGKVGTIKMFTSTDPNVWAAVGTTFTSSSGPTGRAVYFDLDGAAAPVFSCREGVFAWDVSAAVWQQIFKFPTDDDNNGLGLVVARGVMWVGGGDGAVWRISYANIGGQVGVDAVNVGPNRRGLDGLITERQGYVTCREMSPSAEFLDVAYGGHSASHKASILRYSFENDSWHFLHQHGTANQKIRWLLSSSADDDTVRLHWAVVTGSAATDERFMANHLENPAAGGTFSYEASGFIELAEDSLTNPHASKTIYNARLAVDGLSTGTPGDQYVEHEYGLDAAGWQNVSNFGNYVSTDKALFFGKTEQNTTGTEAGTPVGISALTIQNRLSLKRGSTATNTPSIREFQLEATTQLLTLEGWTIVADITNSMALEGLTDPETVITNLETVRDSVPAVTFTIGGASTTYVKMKDKTLDLELVTPGGGDGNDAGRRSGKVRFSVEERQVAS